MLAYAGLVIAIAAVHEGETETLPGLTLVPQEPRGAACLDGSAPGYWIRNATAASDSKRFVIHAQGGGWCYVSDPLPPPPTQNKCVKLHLLSRTRPTAQAVPR
jgi:hypothetical protein